MINICWLLSIAYLLNRVQKFIQIVFCLSAHNIKILSN